jgi:hypothetical protein
MVPIPSLLFGCSSRAFRRSFFSLSLYFTAESIPSFLRVTLKIPGFVRFTFRHSLAPLAPEFPELLQPVAPELIGAVSPRPAFFKPFVFALVTF